MQKNHKMFEFDKAQRLHSKKRIETLFRQGKSFLVFPLSVRYIIKNGEGSTEILVVCPKRYQKLAVNRNRIKRLIRENYRLNSIELKTLAKQKGLNIDFSVSYVHKEMSNFVLIEKKMQEILSTLQKEILNYQNSKVQE